MKSIRTALIMLAMAMPAVAQAPQINFETARLERVQKAVRTNDKISLDGRLDEPSWSLSVPASNFLQIVPHNGEPSPEHTEVRILYDDDNLYVGFLCLDSRPDEMVVNQLREDFRVGEQDGISVLIDSVHDRRSGFIFSTTPVGAKRDAQIIDSQTSDDWDGVWDVATSRNDQGWVAEYRIPFKTLRFSQSPTQEWGLNLNRRIMRLHEEAAWSPIPIRYRATRMSLAGTLVGLENIHQGRNFMVKPFVAAGFTQARVNGELRTLQSLSKLKDYDGGLDAKYGLTQSLTLDATYRTDFAQVEVDQQQVNLTRFNLQFPEKRDFFLENAGTFNFGDPGNNNGKNLIPFFSRRIGLSATGTPIPIVGGARVSGKLNHQYELGFLAMKTESDAATPSNTYTVARVKRNLFGNSFLGTLFTDRNSTLPGDHNRVYGTDLYLQFYDRLDFTSYLLKSDTPTKTGKDQSRRLEIAWRDNDVTIATGYDAVQTNFNPEVGFIRRRDFTQYSQEVSVRPRPQQDETIRNFIFSATGEYFAGGNGKVETRTQDATAGLQFQNNGQLTFTVSNTFDRLLNPFKIRPDLAIASGDYKYHGYAIKWSHNPSGTVAGTADVNWGQFWDGQRKSASGTMAIKPNYHLNVQLNFTRDAVALSNGSFTTNLAGARFIYGFTPRSFINAYFQYNAETHQVSSNVRFNITHHPLSDLYIVYNDTRDTTNGQVAARALIVKFTNVFNF
jgi:hypothetical protein